MSKTTNNGPNEWVGEWLNAQQNFWQSWTDMASKSGLNAFAPASQEKHPQWTDGLEQWWQAVSPQTPDVVSDMFQRVLDMGKNFTNLAEQGFGNGQKEEAGQVIENWLKQMEDGFSNWTSHLMGHTDTEMPDWLGLNKTAMEAWDSYAEQLSSGVNLSGIRVPGFEEGKSELYKVLNTPAMGQWREDQEHVQLITKLILEYQESELTYKLAFAEMGSRSVEALRKRLTEMTENGAAIETVREFYDLWVEVNEAVYGEFAMTDEYQVVYGDMVNSLMALRKEINRYNEKIHKAMNIPTRTEINALHQRLQEQRRENRRLRTELNTLSARISSLETAAPKTESKSKTEKPKPKVAKTKKAPPKPEPDDLSEIKGVGPRMTEKLYAMGIDTLAQIAQMQSDELSALDKALSANGKVLREEWAKQAETLMKTEK